MGSCRSQPYLKKDSVVFQMRWFKHKGSAMLLAMLDRIDAFKKGYVTADNLEKLF